MRRGTENDRQLVIQILSEAFDTNKSVNYVVKQDGNRRTRIERLMDYSFNVCNSYGEVWVSDDQQACALILHPDKKRTSLSTLIWDIKLALFVIGITRVNAVLKRENFIKSNHPLVPISYLWFIGVNPQLQGKGIGSSFINEVINQCEKEKRPIYLETSMERNLPFYKKFGFEIFHSLDLSYTLFQLRRV